MHVMKDKAATLKALMSLSKLPPAARRAALRNELKRRGRDPSRQALDGHVQASEIEPSQQLSPPPAHPASLLPVNTQASENVVENKMKNFFRWLLVLPASLAAMFATFFVLGWTWQISRVIGIVPQNGFIDIAFATLMINGAASAVGVYAGAFTAPSRRHIVAIAIAVIVILTCIFNVVFGIGNRAGLSAATGWIVWTNIGQVGGALIATFGIFKEEKRILAKILASKAVSPDPSGLTPEEAEDIANFQILSKLKKAGL